MKLIANYFIVTNCSSFSHQTRDHNGPNPSVNGCNPSHRKGKLGIYSRLLRCSLGLWRHGRPLLLRKQFVVELRGAFLVYEGAWDGITEIEFGIVKLLRKPQRNNNNKSYKN